MNRTKHVQGTLAPTKLEAVNTNTRGKLLEAAEKHGLGLVITDAREDGVMDVNSLSPAIGGSSSVFGILAALSNFLFAEGVKELGLEGTLTVTVITSVQPVVIPMTVKANGSISYGRSYSHWTTTAQPQLVETVETPVEVKTETPFEFMPLIVVKSDECGQCEDAKQKLTLTHQ